MLLLKVLLSFNSIEFENILGLFLLSNLKSSDLRNFASVPRISFLLSI